MTSCNFIHDDLASVAALLHLRKRLHGFARESASEDELVYFAKRLATCRYLLRVRRAKPF